MACQTFCHPIMRASVFFQLLGAGSTPGCKCFDSFLSQTLLFHCSLSCIPILSCHTLQLLLSEEFEVCFEIWRSCFKVSTNENKSGFLQSLYCMKSSNLFLLHFGFACFFMLFVMVYSWLEIIVHIYFKITHWIFGLSCCFIVSQSRFLEGSTLRWSWRFQQNVHSNEEDWTGWRRKTWSF